MTTMPIGHLPRTYELLGALPLWFDVIVCALAVTALFVVATVRGRRQLGSLRSWVLRGQESSDRSGNPGHGAVRDDENVMERTGTNTNENRNTITNESRWWSA